MYFTAPCSRLSSIYRKLYSVIAFCLAAAASPLDAQFDTSIVPHRYIVVYRNASIPGDAESRAHTANTRLLHRNERFGIAVLSSVAGTDDAAAMRRLATLPNVETVLHDRTVSASRLVLRTSLHPASPLDPDSIHVQPTGPASGYIAESPLATGLLPRPDTFYDSSLGWAVRQVGGYGNNIPGGPGHGPWDTTVGRGVRIAILDSGVDANHPDIAPNLAFNLSEINQDPKTGQPSACDDGSPQDQSGHGTWTASLAAGAQGLGTGQVIGVAPAAVLLNIKVLQRMPDSSNTSMASKCSAGQPGGLLSWVIQGIEDAMANRADVISMSLGTTVDLSTGEGAGLKAIFDRVTYAASQAGIVLIAAAGNDGYNLTNPRYAEIPAQSRNVLAIVASTNPDCAENLAPKATCTPGPITLAYYSNYGAPLNALAAPGGSYPAGAGTAVSGWIQGACSSGIPATIDGLPSTPGQSYGCFNLGHTAYVQAMGTSAATPLAAGVAALLISAHPDWSPNQVIAAMRSTAVNAPGLPVGQISAAAVLAATP